MKSANTIIDECRELLDNEDFIVRDLINEKVLKRQFVINKQYEKYGIKHVSGIEIVYTEDYDVNLRYLFV